MFRWLGWLVMVVGTIELAWLAFRAGRAGVGPRLLLSRAVAPWMLVTVVSISVALWAAARIDRIKAGELPRELLGEAQAILWSAFLVFTAFGMITAWKITGQLWRPGQRSATSART